VSKIKEIKRSALLPTNCAFTIFHISLKVNTDKGFSHIMPIIHHPPLNSGTTFGIIHAYFFTKKIKGENKL